MVRRRPQYGRHHAGSYGSEHRLSAANPTECVKHKVHDLYQTRQQGAALRRLNVKATQRRENKMGTDEADSQAIAVAHRPNVSQPAPDHSARKYRGGS